MSVLFVSPTGQDSQEGTANFPLKTITRALQQARPGSVVQLAPGTYDSGEQFPLIVPDGVTLTGTQAAVVTLRGGGPGDDKVHVALVLGDRAQIRELTVTNPEGTGLLTRTGMALIVRARVVDCAQHGLWVGGSARPFVSKTEFLGHGGSGVLMGEQSKGEMRQNQFERSDTGLFLSDQAAPLVSGNVLMANRLGIVIAGQARPVLRQNQVLESKESGLWTQDRALPDLGQPQDLGDNVFEGKTYDILSEAIAPVVTAGNRINPLRVKGAIAYLPSQVPDAAAVPDVLLGNSEPVAWPEAPPTLPEDPVPVPSLDSRFHDVVGHWAAPFIEALAEKELIKGFLDGSFAPDSQVSRAQFAALIKAAFPVTILPERVAGSVPTASRFVDVTPSFWATEAIGYAQRQGFISGFPDGTFRPNAPLTRVQAVVALVSGLGLGAGRSESLQVYRDRAQVPSYAIEPVAAATARSMVVGYPDPYSLRPLEPITRAETAALVHQALVFAAQLRPLASPFILQPAAAASQFRDLPAGHWARPYIDGLVKKGWLSGFNDGTFRPDAPISRAQFAALVVGAFKPEAKRPPVRFRDVPADFWAAEVIQQAYQAQFISGFPDLTFDPNAPLTKLQALLALVSGLNLQVSAPEQVLERYRDRTAIARYAEAAIATATQLGLVFNYPRLDELRPSRIATRSEVAAMVYQGLVINRQLTAIASPYQVLPA